MPLEGTKYTMSGTDADDGTTNLAGFRKPAEIIGWVLLIAILWGFDLMAELSQQRQAGASVDEFRLVSEQVTSAIAAFAMVPFVVQWLGLFPLQRAAWPRAVIGHTAGCIVFAFGHYAMMVALRFGWYTINDLTYIWREPFVANLIVEFQKDIKVYIGFVVLIAAYQVFLRSREPAVETRPGRLLVQTGSGESVLQLGQIDYLEAARNYVAVHADGREYILRETMTNVMNKLAGEPFVRSHRSFIVNVDRVSEIRAVDDKLRIFLKSGASVPLSRGYRDEFRRFVAG